ncbi:MAG: ABC transporter permease [Pseudomonadota bacterium]|nr:ABC transporter permease [Pseudomonadota bacterium]
MGRLKRIVVNMALLLAIGLLLAGWMLLPWYGALVGAVALGLWLVLARSGRLAATATRLGLASLPQRWGASLVIVIGIAGVVGVLVAMLAMGEGFASTLRGTGSEQSAILLRGGSQAETNSVITRDQGVLIPSLPGIARDDEGRPLVSPELSQIINLPSMADGSDANAQLRGVGPAAWRIRPQVRIVKGRAFEPGRREVVVGRGAQQQFRGLEIGKTLRVGNQDWQVVGVFQSDGDAHESELWSDAEVVGNAYRRSAWQSVTVALEGRDGLERLLAALAADPRLRLDAETTRHYYGKQSGQLKTLLDVLGRVIGSIMAIGAVFGALNSMYAAVAGRAREIATLRAIGFRGGPVVVALMLETMLLALVGGVLGAGLAWLVFNGYSVSTLGQNFSQVVFQFRVSPELLWTGLKWALGIGLVGGLFPALRAARMPVTDALRAV